jgi:histone-lysine N-methyltransferase SETMAR
MEDAILSVTEKERQVCSNIKSMLILFFYIRGILHKEFVLPGQTVTGKLYCKVLRQLRENVRSKWPEMWKNGDWFLHHDNAPAHTSLIVREFPKKNNMTTVPHPAYSPDLAPCDFYVFPKMKLRLKGRHFVSIEDIQAELQQILNTLMPADFSECFLKWQNRWNRCIQAQGDYFEGDSRN